MDTFSSQSASLALLAHSSSTPPLLPPAPGQGSPEDHLGHPTAQSPPEGRETSRTEPSTNIGDLKCVAALLQLVPPSPGQVLLFDLGLGHYVHHGVDSLASFTKPSPGHPTGPFSVWKNLRLAVLASSAYSFLIFLTLFSSALTGEICWDLYSACF